MNKNLIKNPKTIFITGATSGIGKRLALTYAKDGKDITLYLTGRDKARLEEITETCKNYGASVISKAVDVNDKIAIKEFIEEVSQIRQIDLIIANAGISAGTGGEREPDEQIYDIINTNILGVLNTIIPAINLMKQRKSGQIALISSLAGFRGLPSSPSYSASKAMVRVYGEGLRGELQKYGIAVSVVCPGYIDTPMTKVNNFYMPFLMNDEKACLIIKKNLANNKSRIVFPKIFYSLIYLVNLLPISLTDKIFAILPSKPKGDK